MTENWKPLTRSERKEMNIWCANSDTCYTRHAVRLVEEAENLAALVLERGPLNRCRCAEELKECHSCNLDKRIEAVRKEYGKP